MSGDSNTVQKSGCLGKFIYSKVNRVRLRPPQLGMRFNVHPNAGSDFLTGSWDDDINKVQLWRLDQSSDSLNQPVLLSSINHTGDINQIRFLGNGNLFATASSDGSINVYEIGRESQIVQQWQWCNAHYMSLKGMKASCNDISFDGDSHLVSVGEDGRIFLLKLGHNKPLRIYEEGDSCCISGTAFIKHDQVVASNMRGQMNLFDLRSDSNTSSASFVNSGSEHVGISCICKHPTQHHIICTGAQDGSITFWDLRQEKRAVTFLKGHDQCVNEIQFHPNQPEHLFSCSENGDIWHWNGNSVSNFNFGNRFSGGKDNSSAWYLNEAIKHRVETVSMMPRQQLPINCLDVQGKSLIVGGDNEAFYFFNNILI